MKIILIKLFRSKYCVLTFFISLLLSYMIIPETVFCCWYWSLAVLFMITFSMLIVCVVRNLKDKFNYKTKSTSFIGLIGSLLGFSVLQVCTIGAPVCAGAGVGLIGLFFPGIVLTFFENGAVWLIGISILIQLISLQYMGCLYTKS